MAIQSVREVDRIIHSFVRFIIGANKKHRYFEKSNKVSEYLKRYYEQFRGKNICPFCFRRYRSRGALATHMLRAHYEEIKEILT